MKKNQQEKHTRPPSIHPFIHSDHKYSHSIYTYLSSPIESFSFGTYSYTTTTITTTTL